MNDIKNSMTEKEYLDWIEKHLLQKDSSCPGVVSIVYIDDDIEETEGKNLRDAIDNAISDQNKKDGKPSSDVQDCRFIIDKNKSRSKFVSDISKRLLDAHEGNLGAMVYAVPVENKEGVFYNLSFTHYEINKNIKNICDLVEIRLTEKGII